MMGMTSSINRQSLGKIVQRAPAVGAKMWCLLRGRIPRSGKLPVLNLLTGQKNQVFRPAGATRCTDSGQALQDRRASGSAWPRKISHQKMNETIYDEEGKGEGWEREGPKLLLNQGPSESCYATDKAGGCTPAPNF